jgi:hypothetical protein
MAAGTLFIAAVAAFLVTLLSPPKAFAAYVAVLLFYPTFLVISLGPLDISVGRIVVAVLLIRCIASPQSVRRFKWCRLDRWVVFGTIISMVVPLTFRDSSFTRILESWGGSMMDSAFAYFVARFCITSRSALVSSVKLIAVMLVGLALLGVIEAYTGWQPFIALRQYCPWVRPTETLAAPRFALHRAVGPFGHPIMFGAAFALFLPLVYCLRHESGYWRKLSYFLVGIIAIGALSSVSSGPLVMVIIITVCLVLEHFKQWVKPLIFFLVFSCVMVGIISNRPFYHVIASYANPIGGSSWHRAKLIDLAIGNFDQWWLAGYGSRDPGWGKYLGMTWTDITNQYIGEAVTKGIFGLIALLGLLIVSVLLLIRVYKSSKDPVVRSWCWAMGSIIVMLLISFNACTLFGQTATLFYCIVGMIGSSSNLIMKTPYMQNAFKFVNRNILIKNRVR